MKVDFVTKQVPIGKLWEEHAKKYPVHSTRTDPDTGETIYEIPLPIEANIAVMSHDGMKFADTLFKNIGETTRIEFENNEHIEGLKEHKLLSDKKDWQVLSNLYVGGLCMDKDMVPQKITSVSKGRLQDVFDIQVPDGHHYIANGMVSHNSTLAAQLGFNWADMGEDVTIVPLEMSKAEMTARLMANASSIDVRKILFGKMSEDERKKYWKAYKRFVVGKKKTGGTFRIFKPTSDMAIEEIMASIYPFGSRIVIIDYISLLKGVDGDDAWQKLGAVARYCKIYAEMHNIIVVLLCQVSDEGVIRYARSIAEHANYAWKFVATAATREHEIINIEQLKARNGRMFDFTLSAKMAFMQIRDLEQEEREELQSKTSTGKDKDKKGGGKKKFGKGKGKEEGDSGPAKSAPSNDYLKDLSEDDDD